MSDLIEDLRIRTPLVWVNTTEPERVGQNVAVALSDVSEVHRVHPLRGLQIWDPKRSSWVVKLVEQTVTDPENGTHQIEAPVEGVGDALGHVFDNGGILLLSNAHKLMDFFLPVFQANYSAYRDGFHLDDLDSLPAQMVLMSTEPSPPAELAADCKIIAYPLPTEGEIAHIAATISSRIPDVDVEAVSSSLPRVVRAGLGMSEQEFVHAAITSVREHGSIDPDFVARIKLEKFKNNGILEIRHPKYTLEDVGGLDNVKELINLAVQTWQNPDRAAEFGIEPITKVLLTGIPGTGKSLICEAVANALGLELGKMGVSQMMSKWIGESESNMRSAFKIVDAMKPMALWIDEFGRDVSGGSLAGDGGTTNRVHGEFLTGVQELSKQVFLLAAANDIDHLPPEMLRAGRFDKIMFVGLPAEFERAEIFSIHLRGIPGEDEFDITALAEASETFTGSEIQSAVAETKFKIGTGHQRHVTTSDILATMSTMRNRIWIQRRNYVLGAMQRALNEWEWASTAQQELATKLIGGHNADGYSGSVKKVDKNKVSMEF